LITEEGKGAGVAIQADVCNEDDCRRIVQTTVANFGRLDILVNNVGVIGARGTALDVDVLEWTKGLEVNVTSMVLMAKMCLPAMRKTKPRDGNIRGAIVNMGSVAGLQGGTPSLLYPTSKGAVVNMTRAMAAHHAAKMESE
jgi:NAD(P)-dependent dehydrogenase (short-subunit alcohol dehydrogenase family)